MLNILIAGFVGGAVRGIVGFIKKQLSYKDTKFKTKKFFVIVILSGIVGLIIANVFKQNAVFAFVVGYAGGDFLENIYKVVKKK